MSLDANVAAHAQSMKVTEASGRESTRSGCQLSVVAALIACVLALITLPANASPAQADDEHRYRMSATVVARSGPSTESDKVGVVYEGDLVKVLCQDAGTTIKGNPVWTYVSYPVTGTDQFKLAFVADYYVSSGVVSGWLDGVPRGNCTEDAATVPHVPEPPPPSPEAPQCVDVRFITARGSGEIPEPTGALAEAIYDLMEPYKGSSQTTALTGIKYPAVAFDMRGLFLEYYSGGWRYRSSKHDGVVALDAYLDAQTHACPAERWVLIGFSQGANVVADAVSSENGTLDQTQQNRLAAVVLIADPRFNPNESFNAGTYDPALGGSIPNRPVGDLTRAVGKIRSWCDARDLVCQGISNHDKEVHRGVRYVEAHQEEISVFLRRQLGW